MKDRIRTRVPECDRRRRWGDYGAALALFALYLQILAVALCPSAGRFGSFGHVPPCQAAAATTPAERADHHSGKPAHDQNGVCPFCAAHCHASAILPPLPSGADYIVFTATSLEPARALVVASLRFATGASPRGPPAAI